MNKQLNIDVIESTMERVGINQANLARKLDVSRTAVTKWLKGGAIPRPDKLLKMALILGLSFDQIVIRGNGDEPVIAYRKKGSRKTTEAHLTKAMEMGRLLRPLVKYLPFDEMVRPATLKSPRVNYDYIQKAASRTRKELGLQAEDDLDFQHLIGKFRDLQAVIIPVLWGSKQNHGNALHIHLPESMTTWVYLNLDVHLHDFKFWMAHELGHILSPELRSDEAENFADNFAGAMLFPREQAEIAYNEVVRQRSSRSRLRKICEIATDVIVSPVTIHRAINSFAESVDKAGIDVGDDIYKAMNSFRNTYKTVSEILFDDTEPDTAKYLHCAESLFESPFFHALQCYLREENKNYGYVQSILDIPLLDAQALARELK